MRPSGSSRRETTARPRGSGCRGAGRARARRRSPAGAGRGPPRGTSRACRRGRAAPRARLVPAAPRAATRAASAAPRPARGRARARRRARRRAPPPRWRRGRSASSGSRARAGSRLPARERRRSERLPQRAPARRAAPFARRPRACSASSSAVSCPRVCRTRRNETRRLARIVFGVVFREHDRRWRECPIGSPRCASCSSRAAVSPSIARPHTRPGRSAGRGRSADERLVVFCHSAPGAGIFDPDPRADASEARAAALGRPTRATGLAIRSPPEPGRRSRSAADDLAAVLDNLERRAGRRRRLVGGRARRARARGPPPRPRRPRGRRLARPRPTPRFRGSTPSSATSSSGSGALAPEDAHAELSRRLDARDPERSTRAEALWLLGAGRGRRGRARAERRADSAGRDAARPRSARAHAASRPTSPATACSPGGSSRRRSRRRRSSSTAHATRSQARGTDAGGRGELPNARLEVAPGAGHLLVVPMWARSLSHLAPGR